MQADFRDIAFYFRKETWIHKMSDSLADVIHFTTRKVVFLNMGVLPTGLHTNYSAVI